MSYRLSIDQGTTSSRALRFDGSLQPLTIARQEFTQAIHDDGWMEHGPAAIWASIVSACRGALNAAGHAETVRARTGLRIDPYYSAAKRVSAVAEHRSRFDARLTAGRLGRDAHAPAHTTTQ